MDYFIKYLNNKKMTFYKKLEKIEVLKLRDVNTLQKEQVAMIEKTPLWHEKIAEWNKIQAYYMESIRKYKPQLLDPSLGESEEDKLRLRVKELEEKLKTLEVEKNEGQMNLEVMQKDMETKTQEARTKGLEEAVGRVVQMHNYSFHH